MAKLTYNQKYQIQSALRVDLQEYVKEIDYIVSAIDRERIIEKLEMIKLISESNGEFTDKKESQ